MQSVSFHGDKNGVYLYIEKILQVMTCLNLLQSARYDKTPSLLGDVRILNSSNVDMYNFAPASSASGVLLL